MNCYKSLLLLYGLLILRLIGNKFHFHFDVVTCQDSFDSQMSTSDTYL